MNEQITDIMQRELSVFVNELIAVLALDIIDRLSYLFVCRSENVVISVLDAEYLIFVALPLRRSCLMRLNEEIDNAVVYLRIIYSKERFRSLVFFHGVVNVLVVVS